MSLSDDVDCLSLTSSFNGKSPMVQSQAPSSSRAPPRIFKSVTLLTKAIPRKVTGSCAAFLNPSRPNGTP